jgi:4-hydroxyphenylpyruvate dioxygenase
MDNHAYDEMDNPMGLDGFEFVEYTSPDPQKLAQQFESLGFAAIAKHRSKKVTLYRQGSINFIINVEPKSMAKEFAASHGASACAMGFRVKDATYAYKRALQLGAVPYESSIGAGELPIPAILGIGGSVIYFVDRYGKQSIYDIDFEPIAGASLQPVGAGLQIIDHLTHNVSRGQMDVWADYYRRLFNFREIRYFDIKGKHTGLISRAMSSPCNRIRIPLNEATEDTSQIEEFIREFNGEGIQHIALSTNNIYKSVEQLRKQHVVFMDVPDTYYEMLEERLPNHGEDLPRLHKNYIIVDGDTQHGEKKLLLQIFTETMLGPVFFEIIQRKGDEGFGEGNFKALFESIERDQIRRGVVKE